MNKVVCRVKRMGGGFGGKESRNIPISLVIFLIENCNRFSSYNQKLENIFHHQSNCYNSRIMFFLKVVAVAAAKVNKPVRLMLDRDDDMVLSGHRYVSMFHVSLC